MNSDEKKNSMQLENYFLALIETDHLKSLSKCLMWYLSVVLLGRAGWKDLNFVFFVTVFVFDKCDFWWEWAGRKRPWSGHFSTGHRSGANIILPCFDIFKKSIFRFDCVVRSNLINLFLRVQFIHLLDFIRLRGNSVAKFVIWLLQQKWDSTNLFMNAQNTSSWFISHSVTIVLPSFRLKVESL